MTSWSKTGVQKEGEHSKTWQKPKEDHPWRQYSSKIKKEEPSDIIPLKEYLRDLADNFDKIEITTFTELGDRRHTLSTLSQRKAAAYICGVLKRNYVQK